MKNIGIFIFDDVEELDFVGPWEVFQMVNEVARYRGDPEPLNNRLISCDGGDITAVKGMRVGAHVSMADVDALDVILIPGGQGTRGVIENTAIMEWFSAIAPGCEWVTSVCTGAFVLAKAGLLDGRRAATHWAAFDEFERLGLNGTLVPDVRYVRDGNVVTSAGVSAGIDMSLWLVGQWFNPQLARDVARAMQYDPVPPYAADV
jgi:transcriptional regulator GlxA family with amidase domain